MHVQCGRFARQEAIDERKQLLVEEHVQREQVVRRHVERRIHPNVARVAQQLEVLRRAEHKQSAFVLVPQQEPLSRSRRSQLLGNVHVRRVGGRGGRCVVGVPMAVQVRLEARVRRRAQFAVRGALEPRGLLAIDAWDRRRLACGARLQSSFELHDLQFVRVRQVRVGAALLRAEEEVAGPEAAVALLVSAAPREAARSGAGAHLLAVLVAPEPDAPLALCGAQHLHTLRVDLRAVTSSTTNCTLND